MTDTDDSLETGLARVRAAAAERQLPIVAGSVSLGDQVSGVEMTEWEAFLDLARKLSAPVLYLEESRGADLDTAGLGPVVGPAGHLATHADEVLGEHADDLAVIILGWFHDGVCHQWRAEASWYQALKITTRTGAAAAHEGLRAEEQAREETLETDVASACLTVRNDPLFAAARNEGQRVAVARAHFPKGITIEGLRPFTARQIALRASDDFWYEQASAGSQESLL
jgi:hypothetical protein